MGKRIIETKLGNIELYTDLELPEDGKIVITVENSFGKVWRKEISNKLVMDVHAMHDVHLAKEAIESLVPTIIEHVTQTRP